MKRAPDIGDLVRTSRPTGGWSTTGIIFGKRGTDVQVALRDGRYLWIPRTMVEVLSEGR